MSSRTLVVTLSTAIALVALQAPAVRAQVLRAAPAPGAPIHPLATANPGGTGLFTVMLKVETAASGPGSQKEAIDDRKPYTSFGTATNVTFQNPVGTAAQIALGQGKPGVAVVQFAPNNQLAQTVGRTPCFVQGCTAELIIRYATAQGTTTYTLKKIRLTQYQLGTPVTATFSYEEYMSQTGAAAQPARATYNVGASPAS